MSRLVTTRVEETACDVGIRLGRPSIRKSSTAAGLTGGYSAITATGAYDAVVVRTAAVRQWVCTAEGAVGDGGSVASQRG